MIHGTVELTVHPQESEVTTCTVRSPPALSTVAFAGTNEYAHGVGVGVVGESSVQLANSKEKQTRVRTEWRRGRAITLPFVLEPRQSDGQTGGTGDWRKHAISGDYAASERELLRIVAGFFGLAPDQYSTRRVRRTGTDRAIRSRTSTTRAPRA